MQSDSDGGRERERERERVMPWLEKTTILNVFSPVPCRFGGMFLQKPNQTALRTGTFFDSPFFLMDKLFAHVLTVVTR